ncbi:glycoside hydrolase family 15 protein [Leifsonia sp. F6_8S_P_1B]|uniref:Glycoside hydrolase family 15 protein n=1 Tax=Leifsonia williamsii TaxID=3035919 RepID=A0ABT8KB03_9MICO|nr:glycoside hydrolase family 15 protein [Leifsonia williamsii]MDN4614625.1 glycoside hydrolase family 15 protein [Leifsonia williamsii]
MCAMTEPFPDIADHGLIGDLQSVALVSTAGSVDWFCAPRFDSPSIFASLLDREKGGYFRIHAAGEGMRVKQMYFPQTAVLITRFMSEAGVGEVIDFMPVADEPTVPTPNRLLVRAIRMVRGELTFRVECRPRFDYGRRQHTATGYPHGVRFESGDTSAALHGLGGDVLDGDDVDTSLTLKAGALRMLVFETEPESAPHELTSARGTRLFRETVAFWREWIGRSTYRGRWREAVERSSMVLKLLQYAPTGALVAAPTAALPEQLGGVRNWDYRYTWIRDSSFSIDALLALGHSEEALGFILWAGDRVVEQVGEASGPLKIMYRIDGSSDLEELTLDHFEGYAGSRPVHIGNGAADQLQLDIYGEAIDALAIGERVRAIGHPGWTKLVSIIDWLADNWDQPDEGVWETRGGRKDFTYGRIMCWVAFDRAIRMAVERGRPAPLEKWTAARDAVYQQVFTRCWNPDRRAFTQYPGTDVLDAITLLMPIVGMISPQDPMWLSTLDAITDELVTDSLVYRYNPSASPDGLPGAEGTFSLCSFFYVRALTDAGRLDEARYAFEKMLTYGNHVGLYAEEIDPAGLQLGNFPQAFTHLALIRAAISLDAALNAHPAGAQQQQQPAGARTGVLS